jgi:hypothetical protein
VGLKTHQCPVDIEEKRMPCLIHAAKVLLFSETHAKSEVIIADLLMQYQNFSLFSFPQKMG